ncbi:MAG: MFS transporter, partial [Gammaproteobacteria bacterium]|nr:MFS transporter [Gammaproteobacteria bacterium]
GWRMVLSGFILMGLIFLILVFRFLENPPHHQKCTTKIWPLFKSHWQTVVKTPNVWIAGLYCCGLFSVITVFASLWANPYLQLRYHLDYLSASHFIAWVPLGFGLGCPILGAINERFISHKRLMILQAALLFCFSLVMMYAGTHLFLLGLSLFCMGFLGGGNVIGFYIAERSVAPDVRGIAIGLCNAITIFGAIVFQPLIGLLWPHFGVHTMLVFPGLLLLSCVMTLIYKNKPTL